MFSFFFAPISSTAFIANASTDNKTILTAKITYLRIDIQSVNSIFYDAIIQTHNPNQSNITFTHHSWCGFEIVLDARIDPSYYEMGGYSVCNAPFGNFSRSYQPGDTYEHYNASSTFMIQNITSTDLPIGFYYFDILVNTVQVNLVSTVGALFLYYGNNISQIQYNVITQDPNRPQNILSLIPQELSSYSQSLQESSYQSANPTNPLESLIFLIPLAVLMTFFGFLYIRRQKTVNSKKYYSKNILINEFPSGYNESTFTSKFQSDEAKNLSFCSSCQSRVDKKDIFCDNCGSRLK